MRLLVLGLSHHSAPVELREQFAFAEADVPGFLTRLKAAGLAREGVLLSTCNRVELYVATDRLGSEVSQMLREFVAQDRGVTGPADRAWYLHSDAQGAEHLFRVACGLESLVLGETEILGQLKRAYDVALQHGCTGRLLNKLFQAAFSTAKRVRSETGIQRGNTSVASVAVELAEKIFDGLQGREVMVIGAGDTSEKTARALLSRGAHSVIVSNRSFDRAATLAEELGGRAIHFDDWSREFGRLDIIISSTSAPHYILDRPRLTGLLQQRTSRPLLLIDLAVPRDIDPEVKLLNNIFLANVDDLQAIATEHVRARQEERIRCEQIIRERSQRWAGEVSSHPLPDRRLAFE